MSNNWVCHNTFHLSNLQSVCQLSSLSWRPFSGVLLLGSQAWAFLSQLWGKWVWRSFQSGPQAERLPGTVGNRNTEKRKAVRASPKRERETTPIDSRWTPSKKWTASLTRLDELLGKNICSILPARRESDTFPARMGDKNVVPGRTFSTLANV